MIPSSLLFSNSRYNPLPPLLLDMDLLENSYDSVSKKFHTNVGSVSYSNGLHINRKDSFVLMDPNIVNVPEFSAFIWFRPLGYPGAGYHILYGDQNFEMSIPFPGQTAIRTGVYQRATRYVYNTNVPISLNQWYHMGFSHSNATGNIVVYFNGTIVNTIQATNGQNRRPVEFLSIGRWTTPEYFPNGIFRKAKIYQSVFTHEEVALLYDTERPLIGL